LAILGGFITFPFIHKANSPEEATFLTDREKAYVKACLAKDAGYSITAGETTKLNFKEWKSVFVDWQTYSWIFQYVRPSYTNHFDARLTWIHYIVLLVHTLVLPRYFRTIHYLWAGI
jgi:hypothetical protein